MPVAEKTVTIIPWDPTKPRGISFATINCEANFIKRWWSFHDYKIFTIHLVIWSAPCWTHTIWKCGSNSTRRLVICTSPARLFPLSNSPLAKSQPSQALKTAWCSQLHYDIMYQEKSRTVSLILTISFVWRMEKWPPWMINCLNFIKSGTASVYSALPPTTGHTSLTATPRRGACITDSTPQPPQWGSHHW